MPQWLKKWSCRIWPLLALGAASPGLAHQVMERVGSYADSDGTTRQRLGTTLTHEQGPRGAFSSGSVALQWTRDSYEFATAAENDYLREVYGTSYRHNDAATVNATQTWEKVAETRQLMSYASDGAVTVRSGSIGASRWFWHETVRVGVDASRTIVDQPLYAVLDYDSVEVGNPPTQSMNGGTLSVRHLATPTTIVDYGVSRIVTGNRPDTTSGLIGIKQFVPGLNGAFHETVTRVDNRGVITEATSYGQVDAWIADTAWVQNLWRGATARLGYRWYRQDETTRAYGDHLVVGSDLTSFGISQEIPRAGRGSGGLRPLTVELAAARYQNNGGVRAQSYEGGITANF